MGRGAKEKQKADGTSQQLCCGASPADLPLDGGGTILVEGKVVSLVTSAAFGHTIGQTILLGYLSTKLAKEADFTLEVFGEHYPVTRADAPLYDPSNIRLKA